MTVAEKLQKIAENEPKVFDAGKHKEWSDFWDAFQLNGTRNAYTMAFGRGNFSIDTFYPKYSITLSGDASQAFYNFLGQRVSANEPKWSLKDRFEHCGVSFDTSKATALTQCFSWCHFTELPTIDFTGLTSNANQVFAYMRFLVSIEKLITKESVAYASTFLECIKLEHIIIEGTIGTDINMAQCPLTKASITNVINALSTTSTGKIATFKKSAVDTAFETSKGASNGSTSEEWLALIATRKNWTISLA